MDVIQGFIIKYKPVYCLFFSYSMKGLTLILYFLIRINKFHKKNFSWSKSLVSTFYDQLFKNG